MTLTQLFEAVVDETTFLRFAKALIEDRKQAVRMEDANPSSPFGPDAGGWENITIENYLEAGVAWAEASNFGRKMAFKEYELNDVSPWRRIAGFLMAGRVYE